MTLARTGVEYDYRGEVIDAHAPELPTRFAKQLAQVVRGAVAIGMNRADALRLAIRCARDSMPPLRLLIIDDLANHPDSTSSDVRKRINKPRTTVDRQLKHFTCWGSVIAMSSRTDRTRFVGITPLLQASRRVLWTRKVHQICYLLPLAPMEASVTRRLFYTPPVTKLVNFSAAGQRMAGLLMSEQLPLFDEMPDEVWWAARQRAVAERLAENSTPATHRPATPTDDWSEEDEDGDD